MQSSHVKNLYWLWTCKMLGDDGVRMKVVLNQNFVDMNRMAWQ